MFKKILIANRGEIACRVITTAKRLGVKTVAVYSDADAYSSHVSMADEAVRIGPPAASESYLQGDRIIQAALDTGAEAIHPGYGFLSENPEFVEAVNGAGLTFIGPSATAIRAMGLKDSAKALMEQASIPVVPGYHRAHQEPEFLAEEAAKIGYPVLIKARAGGGGKGMRLVEDPANFLSALEGARREGEASFGDPACLIEKYITKPRHIEIQVFGDGHGNAIHLFERDCSLQRRHQKVIEEAPAPDMPETVRAAMGQAAIDAAKAIEYQGAGTVEFIVDGSGPLREDGFWFMEMNTRLQVEHPVSEAITGLDFVELQLRVASGEPLPVAQEELAINGWSFEARVYAEDVPKGFLPATGTLEHLSFPSAVKFGPGRVRVDSGVRQGDEISPWYDPMIAKVIVHGPTRTVALNMLQRALAECHVSGSVTNLEFLSNLSKHKEFAAGLVDTGLVARDLEELTARTSPSAQTLAMAAICNLGLLENQSSNDPWDQLVGWRQWGKAKHHVELVNEEDSFQILVTSLGRGEFDIEYEGNSMRMQVAPSDDERFSVSLDGARIVLTAVRSEHSVAVFHDGRSDVFTIPDPMAMSAYEHVGDDSVSAPMPGLVKVVSAASGARVSQGDPLVVLEAMKMEHTLTAPRDGVLSEVLVSIGDQVTDGDLLITLVSEDA